MSVRLIGVTLFAVAFAMAGCNQSAAPPPGKATAPPAKAESTATAGHPTKGPHGGELIELGDEEYHAELVHDEKTDEVTIHLLDAAATKPVAIEAREIVINLKHHGEPEQHKLVADPKTGDAKGTSSRFTAKGNTDLDDDLGHRDADARLQLSINGKAYSGKIGSRAGRNDAKADEHDHKHNHDSGKTAPPKS